MKHEGNSARVERSADTRTRILAAALSEFAANGFAGARTQRIAAAADVNKALLYYYFESKEKLYQVTRELCAGRIRGGLMAVYVGEGTPGERILRTALNHFDRTMGQQEAQVLFQQEILRLHKKESHSTPLIAKRMFASMVTLFRVLVRQGIASGELIPVDWMQMQLSTLGANIFYFLSEPLWRKVLPLDPPDAEVLRKRREHLVRFLGQTIFTDRQHGAKLAERVLTESPMPEIPGSRPDMGRSL